MKHRRIPAGWWRVTILIALLLPLPTQAQTASAPTTAPAATVRVAVLGEAKDFDFWNLLSKRFESETHIQVQTVISGNKDSAPDAFRRGGIDFITMQSGDAIMELVAGGYATDARPWMQVDLAIVGPPDDPAGAKAAANASAAIKKIVEAKSPFVVHASLGADQVVRSVLQANKGTIDSSQFILLLDDHQKHVFQAAVQKKAYTLIGRAPFLSGKLENSGYRIASQGDPILRRPVIAAVANPAKIAGAHEFEARRLAAFLRSDDTQAWIAEFGKGKYDAESLFIPIRDAHKSPAAGSSLITITGDVSTPLFLDAKALANLPQHEIKVKGHDDKEAVYQGVLVSDLIKQAGVPIGNHQMRGPNLTRYLLVEAADGYQAVFALPELDDEFAQHSILLALRKDGQPLDDKEGPCRIIAPQEQRQARWIRRVTQMTVTRAP